MQRYKLTIEYDGRPFSGWQLQKDVLSVQQVLEEAVNAISPENIRVFGSGRTDAGVHALGQVAHLDMEKTIRPDRLMSGMNFYLRDYPVCILAVEPVTNEFDARFSSRKRHYVYRILNRRAPAAVHKGLVWHVPVPLDAAAMDDAAGALVGHHDFTTFRAVQCQSKSPEKTLDSLQVTRSGDTIEIYASARSFLHHQVRSIAGTLKLVGEGKWTKADVAAALVARDRQALGLNAPPDGLYFISVDY